MTYLGIYFVGFLVTLVVWTIIVITKNTWESEVSSMEIVFLSLVWPIVWISLPFYIIGNMINLIRFKYFRFK